MIAGPPLTIEAVRTAADLKETRALFEAYVAALGIDLGFQDFDGEFASLPGAYAPPRGALLLARIDGEAAGCVAVRPLAQATHCEMKRLYVTPAGRGNGSGSALIEAIIAVAKRLGYREMLLDTLPNMHSALTLYRRAGFVPVDRYYDSPLADAVYLSLRLD